MAPRTWTAVFSRNRDEDKGRIKRYPVSQVAHTGDLLGESPVWCEKRQQLFWVDILGMRLHAFTPETNATRTVSTSYQVGCVATIQDNAASLAAATNEGVGYLSLDTGAFTKVIDPEYYKPVNRFNDGKVDPQGRFIVGTMYTQKPKKIGAANLYEWDGAGSIKKLESVGDVTTSNGLGWTADGSKFYYIDSPAMCVMEYPYTSEGVQLPGRVALSIPKESPGAPDGLCVDEEGKVWVALFRGGKVIRFDPATSEVLATIDLPCKHITSCCFGGAGMDRLFITTAKGSSQEEIRENHNRAAGALFVADVGVRGVPFTDFQPKAPLPTEQPPKARSKL